MPTLKPKVSSLSKPFHRASIMAFTFLALGVSAVHTALLIVTLAVGRVSPNTFALAASLSTLVAITRTISWAANTTSALGLR